MIKNSIKSKSIKIETNFPEKNYQLIPTVYIILTGLISLILLFPSFSNLAVFAKGDFVYIESVGLILACLSVLFIALAIILNRLGNVLNKNRILKIFIISGSSVLGLLFMLFVISFVWIGFDVKNQCLQAKREYGGKCSQALSKLLDDENKLYRQRNSAIWVLGQMGDEKALPVLQKYYTGQIPDREPLDSTISQYELEKAIKLVQGGTNITGIFWKWNLLE